MHKISPQYSHQIYISNEYCNALMIHITDIICYCKDKKKKCKTTFIIHDEKIKRNRLNMLLYCIPINIVTHDD